MSPILVTQPTHLPRATEITTCRNVASKTRAFLVSSDRTLVAPVRNKKPEPENPWIGLIVRLRSSFKTISGHA